MILALEMPLTRRLVPMFIALIVVVGAIEMIRRRKLREEYAVLWLAASAALLIFAIFPELVIYLQRLHKVNYLTIIVMACFVFLGTIVMHFATVITRQSEQIRHLAEQMAIMRQHLKELDASGGTSPPPVAAENT